MVPTKLKVLVIRFSSIGDIVLTTPVVKELFDKGYEVHYLTKKSFKTVLEHNPYISTLFTIDSKIEEVVAAIKLHRYEFVIDLHRNLRTRKLSTYLRATYHRFDKINARKWLAVNFKKISVLPDIHIVDRYLDTLPFEVDHRSRKLDYHISDEDHIDLGLKKYIVLVIGAKHATKQIPDDIAKQIIENVTIPVVLIGGPDEVNKSKSLELSSSVVNAVGKYSINQSASIIQQASVVITADTGMMHIAAAMERPIVSIWGNTIPEFGMYPYLPQDMYSVHQVEELGCRPCSKIGYQSCPKGHFKCMKDQNLTDIITAIDTFLHRF